MEQPIIEPIDREILKAELTADRRIRHTNKADNEIYIFRANECPSLMREVGRLREESFREAGGGTGLEVDIDNEDEVADGYFQLIVWDSTAEQIVGGYRFIICQDGCTKNLSTEHYFDFSPLFRQKYMPYTIELGRSFVQPAYQPRRNRKGIYALDNLWDGLGALIVCTHARYFFGKVTMYTSYNQQARNMLFFFMHRYFADSEHLMKAFAPLDMGIDTAAMEALFVGGSFEADYKILTQSTRELGENIPPLINAYMSLSPTMKTFDTFLNLDFGDVEETGILITMEDIYPEKYARYTEWAELDENRDEIIKHWQKRLL